MTPWQSHKAKWQNCTGCILHERRKNVVLARGSLPADILLIGEAPGQSEDIIGKPFCGPAGQLLDKIISLAGVTQSTAFTNLVSCIPLDDENQKTAEPAKACINACEPRLVEFVRMCKPKLIVLVGTLAKKHIVGAAQFRLDNEPEQPEWIPKGKCLGFVEIIHPGAILKMKDPTQPPLAIKRAVIAISDAVALIS